MAVHLCFPGKVLDGGVIVLVAFDVFEGEAKGKSVQDVDNTAFQVILGSQAVVRIEPSLFEVRVDAFQKALVVTVKEVLVPGTLC